MKHSADPAVCRLDIWKKSDRVGLICRLCSSNLRVEGTSYLYDTTTIFPESGLEELGLIMKASLVTPRSKERCVYWKDGDVIQGSSRGWCG